MEKAANSAVLDAAERERRPAVTAGFVQHAHLPLGVAKRHVVLAERPEAARRAIGMRQVRGEKDGLPIAPHHARHRGAGTHPAQQLVFLCSHAAPSTLRAPRDVDIGDDYSSFIFSRSINGAQDSAVSRMICAQSA